jgi:hypothetical protein
MFFLHNNNSKIPFKKKFFHTSCPYLFLFLGCEAK